MTVGELVAEYVQVAVQQGLRSQAVMMQRRRPSPLRLSPPAASRVQVRSCDWRNDPRSATDLVLHFALHLAALVGSSRVPCCHAWLLYTVDTCVS